MCALTEVFAFQRPENQWMKQNLVVCMGENATETVATIAEPSCANWKIALARNWQIGQHLVFVEDWAALVALRVPVSATLDPFTFVLFLS